MSAPEAAAAGKHVYSLGHNPIRLALFIETEAAKASLRYTKFWKYFQGLPRRSLAKQFYIEVVTAREICQDYLIQAKFDVVVVPGGDAEDEAAALGAEGRKKICEYVSVHGGGYYGACAGAYLALTHIEDPLLPVLVKKGVLDGSTKSWHYGLVPLGSKDLGHWARGTGDVMVELTAWGMEVVGMPERADRPISAGLYYGNGPIFRSLPDDGTADSPLPGVRDLRVIGTYKTEKAKLPGTKGQMVGTPAVASCLCGNGRVIIASGHPETDVKDPWGAKFLPRFFRWCAKRENDDS